MINWKVRIANKYFWLALIPAVLVLIKCLFAIFGIELDFVDLEANVLAAVEALFVVLAILGIVTDPTTDGVGDSTRAMTYEAPHKDEDNG